VFSSYGHAHELANLYVAGCSIFPTESAQNPTYTLNALSLRGAEHLAANWGTIAG
jgi:choline dehydrogenase-like flavoprotein